MLDDTGEHEDLAKIGRGTWGTADWWSEITGYREA